MFKEILDFIKNNKWYVLFVLVLLGVYFYQFHGGLSSDSEKWDHFGSYIGGIFSAVTLLSVLHGMQLERKRFNEQKEEFEKDKKEQEERRGKEDFERTFFMLLEQHNLKIENVKNLMTEFYSILLRGILSDVKYIKENIEFNKFKEKFGEVESYFLVLYGVLGFLYVHDDLDKKSNKYYSSILKSYISDKELVVLVYYLSSRIIKDKEQYKEYIKHFSLFDKINFYDLELKYWLKFGNQNDVTIHKFFKLLRSKEFDAAERMINSIYDELERGCSGTITTSEHNQIFYNRFDTYIKIMHDKNINLKFFDNYEKNNIFLNLLLNFDSQSYEMNSTYYELSKFYRKYT